MSERINDGSEEQLPEADELKEEIDEIEDGYVEEPDEDDDVIIAPVRPSDVRAEQGGLIEDEVDGLFDGVDDFDDGAADADDEDVDFEAVNDVEDKYDSAPAGRREAKSLKGGKSGKQGGKGNKNDGKGRVSGGNGAEAESGEPRHEGRHAMTTSRGVVYVESYSDDDYDTRYSVKSRLAKIIVSLLIVAAVVFVAIMFIDFCRRTVDGDRVYNGITLNGKSVAGMTREELSEYINKTYIAPVSNSTLTVKSGEDSLVYPLKDGIIVLPDTDQLIDDIYNYARSGNLVNRAFTVIRLRETGRNYTLNNSINNATINDIITRMNSKNRTKVDPTYRVEDEQVVFTYGSNGLELGEEDIRKSLKDYTDLLLKSLAEGTATSSVSGTVNIVPHVTEFTKLLKINVVNDLPLKAIAPKIERRSPTEIWISEGTDGAEYDSDLLDQIIERINSGEPSPRETEVLPLMREHSFITKEFYEKVLFRNVLGAGSVKNVADDDQTRALLAENREKNIDLAVQKLNGLIIMPGENFSFMESIKAYDSRTGYTMAYENYLGLDDPAEGGGIAYVSTALYNAAYLANAEIITRTKYQYAPLFGLMGFDAYTSIKAHVDLRIKNNSSLPWKITASFVNGTAKVEINGTLFGQDDFLDEEGKPLDPALIPSNMVIVKDRPARELSSQIARRTPYTSVSFSDPTIDEGVSIINQAGINGYTLNLYLIVTSGGKEDKQFLGVESYDVRQEYVIKGTKPGTPPPTDVPTVTPTEEPTPTPTDVPDDPTPTEVPDDTTPTPEEPTEPAPTEGPATEPQPTDDGEFGPLITPEG